MFTSPVASISRSVAGRPYALPYGGNRPSTPGSYTNADVSTVVTSRKTYPRATGAITVEAGLEYEKNGSGTWTAVAGTLIATDYYRVRLTSSSSYETETALDVTVDGTAYTFTVTTMADPVNYIVDGSDFIVDGSDNITDGT